MSRYSVNTMTGSRMRSSRVSNRFSLASLVSVKHRSTRRFDEQLELLPLVIDVGKERDAGRAVARRLSSTRRTHHREAAGVGALPWGLP